AARVVKRRVVPHRTARDMTSPTNALLASLGRSRNMALETRTFDGSWVSTPVHLVVDMVRVIFLTWSMSGKSKRLRHDPTVRFASSTARGRPTVPILAGRAK